MNSKELNVLILLAMNLCCANGGVVSVIKSSTSTISNWYVQYIKPLWATFTTQSGVPPDADISFYEHEDVNYSPSIHDENVILMDSFGDQVYSCSSYFSHLIQFLHIVHV